MLRFHYVFSVFVFSAIVLTIAACSSGDADVEVLTGGSSNSNVGGNSSNGGGSSGSALAWPFDNSGEQLTPSPSLEGLELNPANVIKITYNSGSTPEIDKPATASEVQIDTDGQNVVVRIPNATIVEYNLVLSGTTGNGSLKIYGDVKKNLYLNGVSITNNNGPAINIQKSKKINVHLINGTNNFLSDGPVYSGIPAGEDAKGTFFSEGELNFTGSGTLEVRGKARHAIAVDNDFGIDNGKIIVSEAKSDGIHANDKIIVKGGFLKITSAGDAIQNENLSSIEITGGKIAATTTDAKSHGIASEGPTKISGNAIVQISVLGDGSKGIRSRSVEAPSALRYVEIKGGKVSIQTSGNRHIDNNATSDDTSSTAVGIKVDGDDLFIMGGDLTIKSLGDKAKGTNTDGNTEITGGNVHIEADDDGMKVHGDFRMTSGTVYVKSDKKKAIDARTETKTGGTLTKVPNN